MYSIIKKIHLITCFVISAFLMMYFITGTIVMKEEFFPRKVIYDIRKEIAFDRNTIDEYEIQKIIRSQLNIYGEFTFEKENNIVFYKYYRPSYRGNIVFNYNENKIVIRIIQKSFAAVIGDFHRLKGYQGSWAHKLWAFMYDLSCISLILFAFSGIYMWWKSEKNKKYGIVCLFISSGLTAFTICYILIRF